MNQSEEVDHPYEGQKFKSFEELKKYLEDYGQRNYVKFWIRSSHTTKSLKSKLSKKMNPDLKYVSVKFACIFGGEKIRCRGSGIRRSSTYRNLGCPCMINAVVGDDGNHVKLDTVILEHNHVLCKSLYDALRKTKRKAQHNKETLENILTGNIVFESESDLPPVEDNNKDPLDNEMRLLDDDKMVEIPVEEPQLTEDYLKDIEDKYGRIVKILVVNTPNKNGETNSETSTEKLVLIGKQEDHKQFSDVCRLCLSSKEKLSPIFNPERPVESTILSFKIMGCASIEISSDDGLPNNICAECKANLEIAYDFRIRCENSDSILREAHERSNIIQLRPCWDDCLEGYECTASNSTQETVISYQDLGEENEEPTADEENMPEEDLSIQNPLCIRLPLSCPVCGYEFETSEELSVHLEDHSEDRTLRLSCNICEETYRTLKKLKMHMKKHFRGTGRELWSCRHCQAKFLKEALLKVHESSHEATNTSETDNTIMMRSVGGMKKIVKNVEETKYLCNVCGKFYKSKDRFQTHKNIHDGIRPHVCLACGRGFADRKNLHQHYDVVHLRKARHECSVCQRRFYTRSKMKSHMTMHSGVKPFRCDVCSKTFRLKMNMTKHQKIHNKIRPYRCEKCNATFSERNLLKRHSYKHGGVRPFYCPVCGHGFPAKFCLKKHLRDSKCRGVVIANPDRFQWLDIIEQEANPADGKCVVVYKAEEENVMQADAGNLGMDILEEFKEEANP